MCDFTRELCRPITASVLQCCIHAARVGAPPWRDRENTLSMAAAGFHPYDNYGDTVIRWLCM
jgi:hypothetical protein